MSGAQATSTPLRQGMTPVGNAEAVEERRLLVVAAVAVFVFQVPDHAARLSLAVDAEGIIAHLDDPELAVGAPVERDRVFHQGLAATSSTLNPGRTGSHLSEAAGDLPRGSTSLSRSSNESR